MVRLFALNDGKDKSRGTFEVNYEQAVAYNRQGYGIFCTLNEFEGRRKRENLKKINYWIVDIDEGEKKDMLRQVQNLFLKPTMIVETKRGYHLYWKAKDACLDNYEDIEDLLIKKMNGDKGVKDPLRLLRCPNFYHMKDKNNPFLIKIVQNNANLEYTEKQIRCAFNDCRKIKLRPVQYKPFVYNGDQEGILKRLKCNFLNQFGENSGRRNFILNKIGVMKAMKLAENDRDSIVRLINSRFAVPLSSNELETVIRTTRGEKVGRK